MVFKNKRLCLTCQKYLPCLKTNQYCCSCIKTNRTIQQRPCSWCQTQPLGEENKINQRLISQYRYEGYKERLKQEGKCSKCGKELESAGHHGTVKQRYQTKFWELKTPYKTLCFDCLNNFKGKMSPSKKYTFNKYVKRYQGQ